jgi:hypothetical protein
LAEPDALANSASSVAALGAGFVLLRVFQPVRLDL